MRKFSVHEQQIEAAEGKSSLLGSRTISAVVTNFPRNMRRSDQRSAPLRAQRSTWPFRSWEHVQQGFPQNRKRRILYKFAHFAV